MEFTNIQLKQMSDAARAGTLRAISSARSGHVGIALGAADIMTAVYARHLRFDPGNPDWLGRDRFVLSAGHGSALLYSVLSLAGYEISSLESFRKLGGLPGHPEYGIAGVEATTGPLGQGAAMSVGMALAEKKKGSDAKIYCLCSDGDLMEGVAQESFAFAGNYKLNNLILLWDDNGISIDGKALTEPDVPMRMYAAGWQIFKCDGHDFAQINAVIDKAKKSKKPAFIQCKTTIGESSSVAGTAKAHAFSLSDSEMERLIKKFSNAAGQRLWTTIRPRGEPSAGDSDFALRGGDGGFAIGDFHASGMASTRELSGKYLARLLRDGRFAGTLIGGSADLAESTSVFANGSRAISPNDFSGNFVNYGVREHAMAAIMNGLALGGFRPYGGSFLVFSDYMRPAIRLSALMRLPVIFVFTHDSVALGEDGPTHQPVEQLAGLRLIPNMTVFRPCNAEEVATCWEMALAETERPSCIVLSRQKFAPVWAENLPPIQCGGYKIRETRNERRKTIREITLIATGSEVPLAVEVAEKLEAKKISVSVVSMPSVEKFRDQSDEYKKEMLRGRVIAIEAGATAGWYEFADATVGIDSFGASGAGADVYSLFGFDAEEIADSIAAAM
jgi:transketolase